MSLNVCMVGHGMMGTWHSDALQGIDCCLHTLGAYDEFAGIEYSERTYFVVEPNGPFLDFAPNGPFLVFPPNPPFFVFLPNETAFGVFTIICPVSPS